MSLGLVDLGYVAIGVFFVFITRIPLSVFTNASDGWGEHSKILAQSKSRWITCDIPDSALQGVFPRPALSHYLVSRFPRRIWRPVSVMMNLTPDALAGIFVYWCTLSLLSFYEYGAPSQASVASFAAMILFLTLPILLPLNARMQANNGRSLGFLFASCYLITLGFFLNTDGYVWLFLAASCVALVILTSTFATQVIVCFSLFIGLVYMSVLPVLLIGAVLGLGMAVPKTGFRDLIFFAINKPILVCPPYGHQRRLKKNPAIEIAVVSIPSVQGSIQSLFEFLPDCPTAHRVVFSATGLAHLLRLLPPRRHLYAVGKSGSEILFRAGPL